MSEPVKDLGLRWWVFVIVVLVGVAVGVGHSLFSTVTFTTHTAHGVVRTHQRAAAPAGSSVSPRIGSDIAVGGAAGLLVCCLVGLAGMGRPDPKNGPVGAGTGSRQGWGEWDPGVVDPGDADTLPIPALDFSVVEADSAEAPDAVVARRSA